MYSHHTYDIVPGRFQVIRHPELVIVEGLNVLQVDTKDASPDQVVVSDFFDFSIYVDAAEDDIARWFGERLLGLRATALQDPDSFFHYFTSMSDEEMDETTRQIWSGINLVNLRENIAPTRARATWSWRRVPPTRCAAYDSDEPDWFSARVPARCRLPGGRRLAVDHCRQSR